MSDWTSVTRRGFLRSTGGLAAAAAAAWAVPGCGGTAGSNGAIKRGSGRLPDEAWFRQISRDLADMGFGTPQLLIDLDRLDANCDSVVGTIGQDRYRIVEKSLPSLDLLGHVRARAGVDRFMVMHIPFLTAILGAFPTAEVMMGKVQPTAAVRRFFDELPAADRAGAAARVIFLVDSRDRLEQLAALARQAGQRLKVGVDLDCGLRRAGVHRPADLPEVLAGFVAHADAVSLGGLLGYDGHVTHEPVLPGLEMDAARATFRNAMASYAGFVDVLRQQFPALWRDDLRLNSGGTNTYPLHPRGGVVNDVSLGGGMLRPRDYSPLFTGALDPAEFIATPVLLQSDRVELPFSTGQTGGAFDGQQLVTIYGGGWAAEYVWPPGAGPAPLVSGAENENFVPNQAMVMVPSSQPVAVDDWVFLQPRQADALFQFEQILLVRGGRLTGERWRSFPRRY